MQDLKAAKQWKPLPQLCGGAFCNYGTYDRYMNTTYSIEQPTKILGVGGGVEQTLAQKEVSNSYLMSLFYENRQQVQYGLPQQLKPRKQNSLFISSKV